jgi:prepilin-type N-terminal cleavage/methylation domain-containing protein
MSQLLRPKNADVPAGFSLMEVMVALVVLTIGLMSGALLMANVYKSTVRSRYMSLAATFASEKLEDLNSYSLSDPRAHLAGGSIAWSVNAAGQVVPTNVGPVSETVSGNTFSIDYYDTVTLNNSSTSSTGALNETYEILSGSTVEYVTQTFTPDGIWHWNTASGYPSVPSTTAPTGETFNRQWLIEANTPVAGLTRITVLVLLMDGTVQPPVTFQMTTVRP